MKSSLEHRLPIKTISLTLLLGLGLYLVLVSVLTDWASVWRLVRGVSVGVWLQVVALALFSYGMRFLRWQHLLTCLGHRLPWGRHLTVYLAGFALTLTPAKAGETVRSVYLHPMGVPYAHSLASFVVERLIDLAVVAALASAASAFFPAHVAWLGAVLAMVLLVMAVLRSRLLTLLMGRLLKGTLAAHLSTGSQAMAQLLRWRSVVSVLPMGLLAWAAQGWALYLVAGAMGHELPLLGAVAIYALSILAGAASFVPGGLGATEGAMVLLLVATGMEVGTAAITALAVRGLTLWLAVGLGMICLVLLGMKPESHLDSKA